MRAAKTMITRRVELERFSVISSKRFEAVVSDFRASVARPDLAEFMRASKAAQTLDELEGVIQERVGSVGLMLFLELDLGEHLRKEAGLDSPKIMRFLIGNPLIMKEMARHVPDAGSYAPVTVLIDERADGVHLTYDKMASLLAPYGSPEAVAVARELDAKITSLLQRVAAPVRNTD